MGGLKDWPQVRPAAIAAHQLFIHSSPLHFATARTLSSQRCATRRDAVGLSSPLPCWTNSAGCSFAIFYTVLQSATPTP